MAQVYRGIICKIEIKRGLGVLQSAQELARKLYNFMRYCAVGFNRKSARARGDASLAGKLPKYPGAIGMWKALHDTEEYSALNDRTANYVIRGFDTSMRSWFSNLKKNPDARPPRYLEQGKFPPLTFEIGRNAKWYDDGIVRLSALSGSVEDRYIYARIYLPPLTTPERVESIKILSDGQCAVSYRLDVKPTHKSRVAAIDLGIKRMAVVAFETGESIMYTGALLVSEQRYFQKEIAKCKPSGWKGSGDGRHLPKSDTSRRLYEKWSNRKSLMLRNCAASIVKECASRGVATIVLGDLKGIREDKDWGKNGNQKLHAWPFAEFSGMIASVAEEVGIKVEKQSERNTSKTCCLCGNVDGSSRVERGLYHCRKCGAQIHADVNGAFNQLKKYLLAQAGSSGVLSRHPSPTVTASGTGELGAFSQIEPSLVAKFDLRTLEVNLAETRPQRLAVTPQDLGEP